MLNTGTSLISDVIGSDSKNSAFVYGFYSLMDKFANGAMLFIIIQNYSDRARPLRFVISIVPILCSILCFFFTWVGATFYSHKLSKITGINEKKKDNQ